MKISIDDPRLGHEGRWNKKEDGSAYLAFEGYLQVNFTGTFLTVEGKGICYASVDNAQPVKETVEGEKTWNIEEGTHVIRLFSPWQCSFFTVSALETDGEFFLDEPQARIEFIGDSIMEGYCNPLDACEAYGNNSSMISYASLTGLKLMEEKRMAYNVIAYGGIAVAKHFDNPERDYLTMSERYPLSREYIHGDTPETVVEKWDFARFQPDYICLNLGTNDWGSESAEFIRCYHELLDLLQKTYPKLKRIFVMTPFNNQKGEEIRSVVSERNDRSVVLIDSALWEIPNGAVDCHPSPASHKKAAEKLVTSLRHLL